jgi:hypothetical protein
MHRIRIRSSARGPPGWWIVLADQVSDTMYGVHAESTRGRPRRVPSVLIGPPRPDRANPAYRHRVKNCIRVQLLSRVVSCRVASTSRLDHPSRIVATRDSAGDQCRVNAGSLCRHIRAVALSPSNVYSPPRVGISSLCSLCFLCLLLFLHWRLQRLFNPTLHVPASHRSRLSSSCVVANLSRDTTPFSCSHSLSRAVVSLEDIGFRYSLPRFLLPLRFAAFLLLPSRSGVVCASESPFLSSARAGATSTFLDELCLVLTLRHASEVVSPRAT